MTRVNLSGLVTAMCLVGLAGCGGPNFAQEGSLGGDVKFQGKPVQAARLVLVNEDPAAKPKEIPMPFSGHVEMVGIPAGKYKVYILPPEGVTPPPADIPEKYQKVETSGLSVEIKGKEKTEINYDLTP